MFLGWSGRECFVLIGFVFQVSRVFAVGRSWGGWRGGGRETPATQMLAWPRLLTSRPRPSRCRQLAPPQSGSPARRELLRLPRPALQPSARLATWTDSWRADLTWFQHRLGLASLPASLCSPPPLSSVPMAALVLEDGSVLRGQPFGAAVSTAGEVGKQALAGCRPHPTLCYPSLPNLPCLNPTFSRQHTQPPTPFGARVPTLAPFIPQGQGSLRWGIVIAQGSGAKGVLPKP